MRERTCIVCKTKGPQQSFFRIGKKADGSLQTGSGGRGAYICRSRSCITKAMQKPRLAMFLRTKPDEEAEQQLLSSLLRELPETPEP